MGGMLGGETHRKEALQGRGGPPETGNDYKDGTGPLLLQVAFRDGTMGSRVEGKR